MATRKLSNKRTAKSFDKFIRNMSYDAKKSAEQKFFDPDTNKVVVSAQSKERRTSNRGKTDKEIQEQIGRIAALALSKQQNDKDGNPRITKADGDRYMRMRRLALGQSVG